jgi:hypothetical protein
MKFRVLLYFNVVVLAVIGIAGFSADYEKLYNYAPERFNTANTADEVAVNCMNGNFPYY